MSSSQGAGGGQSLADSEPRPSLSETEENPIPGVEEKVEPSGRKRAGPVQVAMSDSGDQRRLPNKKGRPTLLDQSTAVEENMQSNVTEEAERPIPDKMGKKEIGLEMQNVIQNSVPEQTVRLKPGTATSTFYPTPEDEIKAALVYFNAQLKAGVSLNKVGKNHLLDVVGKQFPTLVKKGKEGIRGVVPGVKVGLEVNSRLAFAVLGVHRKVVRGIDWEFIDLNNDNHHFHRIALSVVSVRGKYKDTCDDGGDTIAYTGEGGRDVKNSNQVEDQKLLSGNLALINNEKYKQPVRLIRGKKDPLCPGKMLYSYDGIYQVESWNSECGLDGHVVYKFTLKREPDQDKLDWRVPKYTRRKKGTSGGKRRAQLGLDTKGTESGTRLGEAEEVDESVKTDIEDDKGESEDERVSHPSGEGESETEFEEDHEWEEDDEGKAPDEEAGTSGDWNLKKKGPMN